MDKQGSWRFAFYLAGALVAGTALGQTRITEHVYKLEKGKERPPATIADVAALTGTWRGEGLGDRFEETWNAPSSGTMLGMFKLLDGEQVKFYELMLLVEEEGSVSMKIKHFNADFSSWEDKPDYVTFRFISADENALRFSGFTFLLVSENEMVGYLAMRNGEELTEEKFVFRRMD